MLASASILSLKAGTVSLDSLEFHNSSCYKNNPVSINIRGNTQGYSVGDTVRITINYGGGFIDTSYPIINPVYTTKWGFFDTFRTHYYLSPGVYSVQIIATSMIYFSSDTLIQHFNTIQKFNKLMFLHIQKGYTC